MDVYFDNCSLQRPSDDKSQVRIRIEAEAILGIIELIEMGKMELVNSSVVEMELKQTPDPERVASGLKILLLATRKIRLNERIISRAKQFEKEGIRAIDALHLAIADVEHINYFCTCDDRFYKRAKTIKNLHTMVVLPAQLIEEVV